MEAPPPNIMRNLVLIKEVFIRGQKARRIGSEVERIIAIHHFDWTVEFLLKTMAISLDVDIRTDCLKEIWNLVNKKYYETRKRSLKHRAEMLEQRNVRNSAQHGGFGPPSESLEQFDVLTKLFLTDVLKEYYEMSFDDLHLSDLIKDDELKQRVQNGEKALMETKFIDALGWFNDAFSYATMHVYEVFYPTDETKLSSNVNSQRLATVDKNPISGLPVVLGNILADIDYRLTLVSKGTDLSRYFRYLEIGIRAQKLHDEGKPVEIRPEEIAYIEDFVISEIVRWGL